MELTNDPNLNSNLRLPAFQGRIFLSVPFPYFFERNELIFFLCGKYEGFQTRKSQKGKRPVGGSWRSNSGQKDEEERGT